MPLPGARASRAAAASARSISTAAAVARASGELASVSSNACSIQ